MSVNMGLQLFPPPPSKKRPGRAGSVRRNAIHPHSPPTSAVQRMRSSDIPLDTHHSDLDGRTSPPQGRTVTPVAGFVTEIPIPRASLSEASMPIRRNSNSSDTPTANLPPLGRASNSEPSMIRSIFPQYNPDLPLEYQEYYPTQASPTHIPTTVISRAPYSPSLAERSGGLRSPMSTNSSAGRFPRGVQDVPVMPSPSSTEELKDLWKVTNGWRVSCSEGRLFCLKMSSSVNTPVHTLSSATQPFYTLRMEPTSTSAHLKVTRQDPNKSPRATFSSSISISSSPHLGGSSKPVPGMEVMITTLEEHHRRFPPNDGLVALLFPEVAKTMALDNATKPNAVDMMQAAEHEMARLVWDDDSKTYYLVHPALTAPFAIQITHSPAWSRVEYTLEHPELSRNLVRLIRDGSGGGLLEVDTGVAARIEAFWIVDVAITAVMVVALEEEKARNVERFEAPPVSPPVDDKLKGKVKKPVKIEEMELDLESQSSLTDKAKKVKEELPKRSRGLLGCLWMMWRCFWWILSGMVKFMASCILCLSRCLSRKP